MDEQMLESLKYPIGRFKTPESMNRLQFQEWLDVLKSAPGKLENCVATMNDQQLDTPYRDGGWTVRQLVHHIADSHLNAYIRLKLALTEDNPTIKPYDEKKWAELPDTFSVPISVSLSLLTNAHIRMTALLDVMDENGWQRTYFHPEHQKSITLYAMVGMYAWHLNHHIAHIENLKKRNNW